MRQRKPFRRIDVEFARTIINRGETLVLDVRDAASFAQSHIDGARHLVQSELGVLIGSIAKDRLVLIYCNGGYASLELAQAFSDFGFQEVYSLDGGYGA